ncbi:MAG: carboxypeptidase regulatory-like domain-containing protein [Alicyclobacillaceae bacterium]|nr:carboxypeptidase regulatory-like domain-containing protein [Alicyclobacillaceae bacterium]
MVRLRWAGAAIIAALAAAFSGVTAGPAALTGQARVAGAGQVGVVSLQLARTDVPVEPWGSPDGQMRTVRGRLLLSGQPVCGAVIAYGASVARTAADGSFTLQIPTGELAEIPVRVASWRGATVGNRPLPTAVRAQLPGVRTVVRVDFPIQLEPPQVSPDGKTVTVRGRVAAPAAIPLSFQVDRYALQGHVYDAGGHPVKGAVVSLTTDGGEGWAKSAPTSADGFYRLKFMPENDEDASFRVTLGGHEYVLPPGKVFHFPEDTSSEVDVTLPARGNVIVDRPPTLVAHTISGAFYQGFAVGVAAPRGTRWTVTAVRGDGSFTATMPASLWRQGPVWFESNVEAFFSRPVAPGQVLPASLLVPHPGDPIGIRPQSRRNPGRPVRI